MAEYAAAQISAFPTRPAFLAPASSFDCHCHVFGPYQRFPLATKGTYSPPESLARLYLDMLPQIGCERGVLVHASAHGLDNEAMLQAFATAPERLRGVAVVAANTSSKALRDLRELGVRGLRVPRLLREDGTELYRNTVDVSALDSLLPGMRKLGLHAQLWITLDQLSKLAPLIRRSRIAYVIDHMGRSEPARGTADTHFRLLCELLSDGNLWVKLTPYRQSRRLPLYEDVHPSTRRCCASTTGAFCGAATGRTSTCRLTLCRTPDRSSTACLTGHPARPSATQCASITPPLSRGSSLNPCSTLSPELTDVIP